MQNKQSVLPVSLALDRGATELRGLKTRLEDLEHHLERIFETSEKRLDSEVISSLQEFDLIVQSTEALADFLQDISSTQELRSVNVCTAGAVGSIRLRDLANRLSGTEATLKSNSAPELF